MKWKKKIKGKKNKVNFQSVIEVFHILCFLKQRPLIMILNTYKSRQNNILTPPVSTQVSIPNFHSLLYFEANSK